MKQDTPILVILGNPPYDGFADVAVGDEERKLSEAYRKTTRVRRARRARDSTIPTFGSTGWRRGVSQR